MQSRPLLAIALLLTTTVSGFAKAGSEEKRNHLQALRGGQVKEMHLTLLDRAYLDTYNILASDNQCGGFFGGSSSRLILDELVIRLRDQTINDTRIAIRMSGPFTSMVEPSEGTAYRVFEQSEINSLGAFYRSKTFPSEPLVPHMGGFAPNTRQARVIILLHELAHLIKDKNGTWLIPDDGSSPQISRVNTITIESKCGQQIRSL
jgi:hypothetical protein